MHLSHLANAVAVRFTLVRYVLASLCALCGDMLLFLALLRIDVPPTLAGAVGYTGGLLLHWLISVRFVFPSAAGPTNRQRLGFIVSAGVGIAVTTGLISALGAIDVAPAVAKLFAIPASFLSVYAIRKYGVFAAR
ncbi:MAG TPA: GtrA family protein [Sphingobium sp.]|nr:GtrA family protein [Sphingobium sp.]